MPRSSFGEFAPLVPERIFSLIIERNVAKVGRDLAGNLLSVLFCVAHLQECLSLMMDALSTSSADLDRRLIWAVTPFEPMDEPDKIGAAVYALESEGRARSGRHLTRVATKIEAGIRTLQALAWDAAAQPRLLGPANEVREPWLSIDELATLEARRRLSVAARTKRITMQKGSEAPQELDLPVLDEPAPLPEEDIVVDGVVDALKHSSMVFELRGKVADADESAGGLHARLVFCGSIPDKKTFSRFAGLLGSQERVRFRLRPLRAARPEGQYVYELLSVFAVKGERSRDDDLMGGEAS